MRYAWGLLRVFNKYLSKSLQFINCIESVSIVPESSISFTMSSQLSSLWSLCLSSIKGDLRQIVLDKTSELRSSADVPKLMFERLKNVIDEENKEEDDAQIDEIKEEAEEQKSCEAKKARNFLLNEFGRDDQSKVENI